MQRGKPTLLQICDQAPAIVYCQNHMETRRSLEIPDHRFEALNPIIIIKD